MGNIGGNVAETFYYYYFLIRFLSFIVVFFSFLYLLKAT